MKVGTIVRDKETDKLGYVCGMTEYTNWVEVYWVDTGEKYRVVNHSLTIIYGGD